MAPSVEKPEVDAEQQAVGPDLGGDDMGDMDLEDIADL